MAESAGKIYKAMGQVMSGMKELGKTERNATQGYSYRGIDSLMNLAHGLLDKAHIIILPSVLNEPEITLGPVSKKGTQFYRSLVRMKFEFMSTEDGSGVVSGPFIGEGVDNSDKASNCAQTAAYKWCLFQTFCIPVKGGLADSEQSTELDEDKQDEQSKQKLGDALEKAFTGDTQPPAPNPPPDQTPPPQSTATQPQAKQGHGTKDARHRQELQVILSEITGGIANLEGEILKKWSVFVNDKGEEVWARSIGKLSGKWLAMILDKAKKDLADMQGVRPNG